MLDLLLLMPYNRSINKSWYYTQHKPFGRNEIQMPEIKVGDRYETKTNKFVGVVQEIDGKSHWTSAQGTVLN
jgi:hypothetical protein